MTLVRAEIREQRAILIGVAALTLTWFSLRQTQSSTLPLWIHWLRGTTFSLLLLPALAAFVGVWTGGRDQAHGVGELRKRGTTPAAKTHGLALAVSAGAILSGWAVALLVRAGLLLARGADGAGVLNPVVPIVAALWLVGVSAISYGIGLGRYPRWVTAPIAAAVAFAVPFFATFLSKDLEQTLPIPWDIWLVMGRWDWSVILRSLAMALAVAAFGVAWFVHRSRPSSTRAATSVIAAVAVAALTWVNWGAGEWRPLPPPDELSPVATLSCVEAGAARLCVHPAHSALLADAEERLAVGNAQDTEGPTTTLRMDLGLGWPTQRLEDRVLGAGLLIINHGRPQVTDCHIEALIRAADSTNAVDLQQGALECG